MARTATAAGVKRILSKGLTGWQAGKLIMQDLVDSHSGKAPVLTDTDIQTIRQASMESADIRDYNTLMALCRGFDVAYMMAHWACKDACLQIEFLDHAFEDAEKRRTVELFESLGPRVVTRKQYEEIVAAQREKKLEFEYSLGYVIERRFYAVAPPEAEKEINEARVDIECLADLIGAMPETYADLGKQTIDQIHRLHTTGKLPAVYHEEDAKEVEPLLTRWREAGLVSQEVMKLLDMLYVTGRNLYECDELPEWRDYIDQYQQYLFDDERFRHTYAILDDCPTTWLDENGYYKAPMRACDCITRMRESLLGLISCGDKTAQSPQRVGAALKHCLSMAERNIRFFLAIKAVLDIAIDAVEIEVPDGEGMLSDADTSLDAHVDLYNIRVEGLKAERKIWQSSETRLEKALRVLPAINVNKLKPTAVSLERRKAEILEDTRDEKWLLTKIQALEYDDGMDFKKLPV
jgi:hypothetical protein